MAGVQASGGSIRTAAISAAGMPPSAVVVPSAAPSIVPKPVGVVGGTSHVYGGRSKDPVAIVGGTSAYGSSSQAPSMVNVPYRESFISPSSAYSSFVAPVQAPRDLSNHGPGDAWESGGYRYHMGDRYLQDGQGNRTSVLQGPPPAARGTSTSLASSGHGSTAYAPGRYGPAGPTHAAHAAEVIAQPQHHYGPLPPSSAPGTPAMLPPYLMEQAQAQDRIARKEAKREKKDKKEKKDKRDKKKKKSGGCCG